jgi:hypothetical protein
MGASTGSLWVQGIGALASAWGAYEVGKEKNKIEKQKLEYEKNKDKITADKQAQAQAELDNAMANVYGSKKKKADKTTGSLSDAFVDPSSIA